ncbi:hypothetical protein BE17_23790 [Sorangium cellulosum]|uniref:Uncharacterized protein n=1 Tax=Sorangium cellulosum TaxID=56 RepID=A0A150RAC2_SORCE|nr:hypothetical protein BE17_23790 [Sorangium cellulosum]
MAPMKRGKRTRRARDVRAKLHVEAERLADDVHRLAYTAVRFQRDHMDRYEREAIEEAHGFLNKAERALDALVSSLGKAAGRHR